VSLGLPCFLLPGGRHFITSFGNPPPPPHPPILWTCPHRCSCCCNTDCVTVILCLTVLFIILSFLENLADRRQKSIFVEFNFANIFAFKHIILEFYYKNVRLYFVRTEMTVVWRTKQMNQT
jgi:hypothetical protein